MSLERLSKHEKYLSALDGVKFTALKNAIGYYYNTLNSLEGGIGLAYFALPGEETEFDNDNHCIGEYPKSFINSIVSFHHFFELHIKDVLSEYHLLLGRKITNYTNADDILNQLDSGTIETNSDTVNFRFAFKLLKKLQKNNDRINSTYKLLPEHFFLLDSNNYQTILKLHDYRNATLHKGNTILGYIAFDYFISQHVLPLVNEILQSQSKYQLEELNKKVGCNINVLDEILKIKFKIQDLERKEAIDIVFENKLCHLAHLKELGRASYSRPIDLPMQHIKKLLNKKKTKTVQNIDNYDRSASLSLKSYKLAQKLAVTESKNSNVHQRLTCPCCGANTLLTYWRIEIPVEGLPVSFKEIDYANCSFCSYQVRSDIHDPYDFKITSNPIFQSIDIGWPFESFNPSRKELDDF